MASAPSSFTSVDLSRLPAPHVVEVLDYEAILAANLAQFRLLWPKFDATVESDPLVKLLQLFSYRELIWRQRVNDAARAVMPAYARGADLDNLAAFLGIARLVIDPGDPARNVPPMMESDEDFRRRFVLAPEGFSVAGPEAAYVFHALSADPDILDASATSPAPGHVLVTLLSRTGSGEAGPDLIDRVAPYVTDDRRRPMTDLVTVQSAQIVPFTVVATVWTFGGPDAQLVLAEARMRLDAYIAACHLLGRDVTRSGILAALHVEGVQNVLLAQPAADLVIARTQASFCTDIAITHAGVDE